MNHTPSVYRTAEQWRSLRDRAQLAQSGRWTQVAVDPGEFCGLVDQLLALRRMHKHDYRPWASSGGPRMCARGISNGIACKACDVAMAKTLEEL